MSNQPFGNQEYYQPPLTPAQTNGKSIASLVLGILSIVTPFIGLVFGIIAIILSAISLREIRFSDEQGRGLSIAGLICGIVGTLIYAILIFLFILTIFIFNELNVVNTMNSITNSF